MKYQLNKADRNRQKRLAAAIRKGLPLTGLLALLPLAGGCGEGIAPLAGDIAPEQSTETAIIRGEIAPAPLAGVPPRKPPTEPSAGSDEESR
ncbi:hypothetical protein [uncultured Victivallis sp.]|uniref:hypothetical protein n=1 Tax=uncultured Victivallis sp. TaxID=354118 RepID=UPI0025D090CB|nr:hypothetical protein [uncultured Victivallis sp.]